jgi:Transposase
VIDLLPERAVESTAAWMQNHPKIRYVSRDRGNEYAQATRQGAPQATPVADRFHLYKNLVEAIEPVVASSYREMRKAQEPLPDVPVPKLKEWRQAPGAGAERQRLARLEMNQERYTQMLELQKRGVEQEEIARRLGMTKRTRQNWNKQGSCPGSKRRRKRRSIFGPYGAHVLKRWKEGCKKGSVLYREIKEKGYRGTDKQVSRFLQTLKQEPVELPALSVVNRASVQEALWLIARPFDHLNEDERADLQGGVRPAPAFPRCTPSSNPLDRSYANAKAIGSKTGKSRLPRVDSPKCNGLRKDLNETKMRYWLDSL